MNQRRDRPIRRSDELLLVGYYLSRCGERPQDTPPQPPMELESTTWKQAYALFFRSLGGDRSPRQFANSLKNTRDSFDAHIESSRVGWRQPDAARTPQTLPARAETIFDSWKTRTDDDLWVAVSRFIDARPRDRSRGVTESVPVDAATLTKSSEPLLQSGFGSQGGSSHRGSKRRHHPGEAARIGLWAETVVEAWIINHLPKDEAESVRHLPPLGLTPGYDLDFQRGDGTTIGLEVKGTTSQGFSSITMTANEWQAASRMGRDYWLVLVSSCETNAPKREIIIDPVARVGTELTVEPSEWALRRPLRSAE